MEAVSWFLWPNRLSGIRNIWCVRTGNGTFYISCPQEVPQIYFLVEFLVIFEKNKLFFNLWIRKYPSVWGSLWHTKIRGSSCLCCIWENGRERWKMYWKSSLVFLAKKNCCGSALTSGEHRAKWSSRVILEVHSDLGDSVDPGFWIGDWKQVYLESNGLCWTFLFFLSKLTTP